LPLFVRPIELNGASVRVLLQFHRLHTDTCVSEFLQGWKLLLLLLVVHMHALLFLHGKVQAGLWWLPRTVRTCRPVKTVDRAACSLSAWQTARFHIFAGKRWGQVRVGRLWLQETDDDDQTCHTSVRNKVHKRYSVLHRILCFNKLHYIMHTQLHILL
jgi:hypothetical protein